MTALRPKSVVSLGHDADEHVLGGNVPVPVLALLDGFPLLLASAEFKLGERRAATERTPADCRHALGDDDRREQRAVLECILADCRHTLGDDDRRERRAASERVAHGSGAGAGLARPAAGLSPGR